MGNGSYDHHHSINHHHQFHQKTIFLPIFCRLSIRDIKPNHRRKDLATADEPSSPKVSCMGQVKRNNRVIGFPAATATTTTAVATRHHRYSKLKKLFSSKTLLPPATSSSVAGGGGGGGRSGSKSCRSSREMCVSERRRLKSSTNGVKCEQDFVKVVDVAELDPPLPVVKRVAPPGCGGGGGGGEVNIWKRRFNGPALKNLQIERVNLQKNNSQLPPTV